MGKLRIEFKKDYLATPISYWVHKELDGENWQNASKYDPPLPCAIPNKGFPLLIIEAQSIELQFASLPEIEQFLAVISQKNMPTTNQLSRARGLTYGSNRHWLSRLPKKLKPWSKREKLIPLIQKGMSEFITACTNESVNNM